MANMTAVQTLYAFRYWIKNNPVKSIEAGITWDDFDAMVDAFCTVNATTGNTLVTVANDPLSYGTACDVPGKSNDGSQLADGAGISFTTPSVAICNQSKYPDTHYGT
jgi:hypothetical protein